MISYSAGWLFEEAADELARLDSTCMRAPASASAALRISTVASLAHTPLDAAGGEIVQGARTLLAANADEGASLRESNGVQAWADFLDEEERRVRGGAPLSLGRLASAQRRLIGDTEPFTHDSPALERVLADPAPRLAALERALAAAALIEDVRFSETAAALILCGAGRTDRVRLLPFVGVDAALRGDAIGAAREGDQAQWQELALEALAAAARARRLAVQELANARAEEDDRLDALGRAAITARRALALLREDLALTMPSLAELLELSRPAAADALERLVSAGLATEVTGRRRDRVYAYTAALTLAEA